MKYRDPVTGNLELFPILNIANKKDEPGGGTIIIPDDGVLLKKGIDVNYALKKLNNKGVSIGIEDSGNNISRIVYSESGPLDGIKTVNLDDNGECLAWLNDNTINIYSNGKHIYMNPDSAMLFYKFINRYTLLHHF